MLDEFNATEILIMAEKLEVNGAAFYRKAAGLFAGVPEAAALLGELAAMEDDHQKVFAAIRDRLPQDFRWDESHDLDGNAAAYIQAMADGIGIDFNADPAALLTGSETLADILSRAIGLEKDSVVFYAGIRQLVPESLGKDNVQQIINEELGHIATLSKRLKQLA